MSLLNSTIETEKEKETSPVCKQIMHKYTDSISLYGLNFEIKKESKLFQYIPSDITTLPQNYTLDGEKIYSSNLSPGVVYSGYDKLSESKVAIKEMRKKRLKEEYQHEMAKNELSIHFSLSSVCSNIVKVRDYFEDENAYYLIMEYSDEPNFFEDLLENRYCPVSDERTLKAFAFDILTGLKEIHKNNVIHCDIKPQNFLLFKNENSENNENDSIDEEYFEDYFLKITDFGFAHVIPNNSDKAYMKLPCGTFAYTAPEVTKNCYVDRSIDIWSFGVCLYQMAVAYLPTAIKQYKYGNGPIPFRACDWSGYDYTKIKDLIERCLEFEPDKRITVGDALDHPWFEA